MLKKLINYTYKFRIYPTKEQQKVLFQDFGNARFVYNEILKLYQKDHLEKKMKWNFYNYEKLLPGLKKQYPFLKSSNSQLLQSAVLNLNTAFKNFFAHRAEEPALKRRKDDKGIAIPQFFEIKNNLLFLPKLKTPIKIELHREIVGEIKSISITKASSNKFFVSVLVKKEIEEFPKVNKIVGIDVGLKTFAVISETSLKVTKTTTDLKLVHSKISNPKYLIKAEKHLKRLQKALSRKQHKKNKKDTTKASKNYIKYCKRISKLHEYVSNQRKDFLQKATSSLINESQVICLEDLNIAGMKKNRHLSKAISDVGWGYFRTFLTYKADWYGRRIIKVDRFFASSKKCSTPACDYVKKDLKLSDRSWTCPKCGHLHDRDENAANNLLFSAIKELNVPSERRNRNRNAHKPVEIKTASFVLEKVQNQVLSVKQETSKRSSRKEKLPTFSGE